MTVWNALICVTFVMTFVVAVGRVNGALPANYMRMSANQKQDVLWKQVLRNPYPMNRLPTVGPTAANFSKLFVPAFLKTSFTWTGDEMPPGRARILHNYGVVCKVDLDVFSDSPFSGVFSTGGVGVLRLSLAQLSNDSFPVGVALKILVDGRNSQNFVLVNTVEGQGTNRNFFAKTMRNIFPPAGPYGRELNPAEKAFQQAIFENLPGGPLDHPADFNNVPLYEQAAVGSDGRNVSTVVAPYEISLRPNPALAYDENDPADFRRHLVAIPAGTLLYTVAVKRTLDEDDGTVIGQLTSRSAMVASPYGDEVLFFNHAKKAWQA
ncbi:hypothetical protein BV898_13470 [Hypsibius exemplaris]|nr:hypothetical protein BV898_13470 [Hypsibius exemplaris]